MSRILHDRFSWGVCIDDIWTYAGILPPKSIIIPHLLSVRLPQGPFSMNFGRKRRPSKLDRELSTVSFFELSGSNKKEFMRLFSKNLAVELKRDKIGFVRCWFQWNLFQPEIFHKRHEQKYQFPLDEFVNTLNREGIGIIAVLGNGYYRFLPKRLDIENPSTYSVRLGEASRKIVKHYSGKISMWQLENEPNWWLEHFASDWRRGGIWFEPNFQERVLSELHRIVLEEDPETPTMINLEADSARAFYKSYTKYCDVLGLDFYPNYTHSSPIDVTEVRRKVSDAKELSNKPVMIAETGYPSGPSLFGYSQEKQASYVKLICEEAYSNEAITGLGMWRLSDPYWLSFPFQENSFGLIDRQGVPKLAWHEYQDQIKSRK